MTTEEFDQLTDEQKLIQINKACDEVNSAISLMTEEERDQLSESALAFIFPNGRWGCSNGHPGVWVAKEKACRLCGEAEQNPQAPADE